ncbi:MAG: UTRA domain-containing protein [Streptosporangiales bacterium]|nr:UTRA domain-containing protein [Streptosporangiales bacterium]
MHVLPFRLAPDLLDKDLASLTSHAYLRNRGVELVRARLYVDPYALDAQQAKIFGLGSPSAPRARPPYRPAAPANSDPAKVTRPK